MAYKLKTLKNKQSVAAFLASVKHPERKKDAQAVLALMKRVTGEKPFLWGTAIVGFGSYEYHYPTGQTGEWPMTAFSPRAAAMTLYIMPGFENYATLLTKLGPHKTGKSCLYIKRLADIDLKILEQLVKKSYLAMKKQYSNK